MEAVIRDSRIQQAFRFISQNESNIEADQIRLSLIPAPPFNETERARAFADELRSLDLRPLTDAIGNIIATFGSHGPNPVVAGAHLDTIFPASTHLGLRRKGRVIYLPGISDNGSGIAAVLWVLRAAKETGLRFRRPVMVVGNVGEEGRGNLRGIRHLFNAPPWEGRNCDFIAIDGGGLQRITHQALGSRRYRIQMSGPGGHSWADFGRPNPVHAMAAAIQAFTTDGVTRRPGTSFNVGVIQGGIAVNAIPSEATMEVDLRSMAAGNLDALDAQLQRAVSDAATASGVECYVESMGERPTGLTPPSSTLVQAALEITRRFGIEPQLDVGSTDANIPMAMGIPAIALGAGGNCGSVHTPEEWFDPTQRDLGLHRLLALIAVMGELV
ncbi:MAG: M20/M25/M40 family metallo-hydrolase [Acidobacteria bacterium]|nr:M20/M25/M40 family metallo-hydrolase [Acidobacteriota bacterium]